jgi:Flp pilus assembly pilin Flp
MNSRARKFAKSEQGATMFEYAILVGVIALVAIGGAMLFGNNLHAAFQGFAGAAGNTNQTATQN